MPIIDRIELYHATIPLAAPFAPAWVPGAARERYAMVLIHVFCSDGIDGWSGFPAAGRERAGIGDGIADLFLGQDAADIDLVHERIKILAIGGLRHWWIEPAFWDIKAKAAGQPLYRLLGGDTARLRLYASSGEIKAPEQRRDEAEARLAEGFDTLKIRVHDWDEKCDQAQLEYIARAMQGRMHIAVDCNQAFRLTQLRDAPMWDLPRAKRFADVAAGVGAAWVEEPLYMEWFDALAELRTYARVPIAGGELHTSGFPELAHMVERRCYHIFQPDAMWAGGVRQCMQIGALCRARGLDFTPHSWSSGFGFIVNAHVMAASGFAPRLPFEYPLSPPGWTIEARDALLAEPWQHDRGWFDMPQTPGLGFVVDRAALARYATLFFSANRQTRVWMPESLR